MGKLRTEKTQDIKWKPREINVDISRMNFQLDALQEELLFRYIRQDMNFKRAFCTNYTSLFMQFIRDKVRLGEPITLSVIGSTRGGKSTSAITVAGLIMEAKGKLMSADKICENEFAFIEDLKKSEFGDCYVIDESKQAVFGVGSMAKKFKLQDVQNIIAVNNISTIWLKPDKWSFEGSQYGLRAFGRGQYYYDGKLAEARVNRFMLYNLQESSAGGSLPLGMVYIPHFQDILKNGDELWESYSAKKQAWVNKEVAGGQDNIMNAMYNVAERLWNSPQFKALKTKGERQAFISLMMGNEVTKGEISQLLEVIKLMDRGITLDQIKDVNKLG